LLRQNEHLQKRSNDGIGYGAFFQASRFSASGEAFDSSTAKHLLDCQSLLPSVGPSFSETLSNWRPNIEQRFISYTAIYKR